MAKLGETIVHVLAAVVDCRLVPILLTKFLHLHLALGLKRLFETYQVSLNYVIHLGFVKRIFRDFLSVILGVVYADLVILGQIY